MAKLTITLTLTDAEADTLLETLDIGACHRFAPRLQSDSHAIKKYVRTRIDAAIFARERKRRKAFSTTAEQRASNDQAFASLAEEAAAMIRQNRSNDNVR